MKEIAWRWHEFGLFIQTYEEYFAFAENKNKEVEDDGLTREDLLDFQFLGFIVHETEGKEVNKEEEDKEGKEEKKESSFTLPPPLLLELESWGFLDGDKKEVGEEKKEEEREKKNKEVEEDDGLTHTHEDLLDFQFLGFIVHETEGKEVNKEEEDKEGKEEKKESSVTLPPSLLLELESLGFLDGDKKGVGQEKKEQEQEKKQEEDDDDGYVLIQTPEEELELDLLDYFFVERRTS